MYAVTAKAKEYVEVHPETTGAVRLYQIEECRVEGDRGGWALYWYNDGSDTGCVLAQMWGWSGDCDIPQPLEGDAEDIFDEAELETLRDHEEDIIPAPFGVRHCTVTEAEFEDLGWEDLPQSLDLGTVRVDRWAAWQHVLSS